MAEELHPTTHWSNSCMSVIKAMSVVFLILSLIYLAVAGANFAVLGAVFIDAEWAGTARAAAFGGVAFALVLALSLVGMWATSTRAELHAMIYTGLAAATAVLMVVEVVTGCFGARDAAFGIAYINGFSLFTGVLAAVCCGLAISSIVSNRRLALSDVELNWPSADELVAALDSVPVPADVLQPEAPAADAMQPAPEAELSVAEEAVESEPAEEETFDAFEADEVAAEAAPLTDEILAEDDPAVFVQDDAPVDEGTLEDEGDEGDALFGGNYATHTPEPLESDSVQPLEDGPEPEPAAVPVPDVDATAMLRIDSRLVGKARAGRAFAEEDVVLDPLQDLDEPDLADDEDDDEDDAPFTGRHFRPAQ